MERYGQFVDDDEDDLSLQSASQDIVTAHASIVSQTQTNVGATVENLYSYNPIGILGATSRHVTDYDTFYDSPYLSQNLSGSSQSASCATRHASSGPAEAQELWVEEPKDKYKALEMIELRWYSDYTADDLALGFSPSPFNPSTDFVVLSYHDAHRSFGSTISLLCPAVAGKFVGVLFKCNEYTQKVIAVSKDEIEVEEVKGKLLVLPRPDSLTVEETPKEIMWNERIYGVIKYPNFERLMHVVLEEQDTTTNTADSILIIFRGEEPLYPINQSRTLIGGRKYPTFFKDLSNFPNMRGTKINSETYRFGYQHDLLLIKPLPKVKYCAAVASPCMHYIAKDETLNLGLLAHIFSSEFSFQGA